MRRHPSLALALLLALTAASGCMVLDEIDKANAKMPPTAHKKKAEAESPAPAATGSSASRALLEQSKQWWNEATSLSPAEVESGIVSCRLREGTQFMSRDDCLSQGGRPSDVSG